VDKLDRWDWVLLGGWIISIIMMLLSGQFASEGLISKTSMFWMALTGGCFAGRNLLAKNRRTEL